MLPNIHRFYSIKTRHKMGHSNHVHIGQRAGKGETIRKVVGNAAAQVRQQLRQPVRQKFSDINGNRGCERIQYVHVHVLF